MAVTITKPASGATLTGLAVVEATFSGKNFEIATVTVDGQQLASDSSKPIAFSIDTTKVVDGPHTLTVAVRYRTAGGAQRWQKTSIPITTKGNDMKVDLSTSGGTANLAGTVTVTATVSPSSQALTPVSCKFSVDNGPVLSTDTSYPLTFSWNTTSVADGTHTLRAVVTAGPRTRQATGALGVSVKNTPVAPGPDPPPPAVPVNTTLPVFDDTTPQEGQTIFLDEGTWTNSPTGYTYQWLRCNGSGAACVPIPSATHWAYTCTAADVGSTLRCSVTALNAIGPSQPVQTAATTAVSALVAAVPVLVSGGTPTVTGTPQVGNTLASSNGNWTQSPTSYTRQWKRCQPSPVTSSINDGDTIVQGQVWTVTANPDATLVEFYADGSKLGEDTSEPFQITLNLSLAAHQLGLAITTASIPRTVLVETAVAGVFAEVTCSAGPAVVTGAGDSIAGATSATYAVVSADVEKTLRCLTTAVNGTGSSLPVQTEQTATVTSGTPPPPPPPPPPAGAYQDQRFETGLPSGWSESRTIFGWTGDQSKIQILYPDDPFGTGQGKVLLLRNDPDPAAPLQFGPRQLAAIDTGYNTGAIHAAFNIASEETWYRTKLAFPSGTKFSPGQYHWLFEWHVDADTQNGGQSGVRGNSPGLAIEGGYPYNAAGSTNPGLIMIWRSGNVDTGQIVETFWPSTGTGAFGNWIRTPILYNHWYDFVWRVIWSANAGVGYLAWWMDGVKKVDRQMATRYVNSNLVHDQSNHSMGVYNYRYPITARTDVYCSQVTFGPTAASVGFTP